MAMLKHRTCLAPLALSLWLILGVAGCEDDSAVEDAAEDASETMESAGEEVKDKTEDMRDKAEDAADERGNQS